MKVLVTGGAGFIGSNLVHYLLNERPNWQITVLDSLSYAGNLENIAEPLNANKIKFLKVDLCDAEEIDKTFSACKYDLVFHLAAESHVDRSILSGSEFVQTNILGTQNLINSCRKSEVGKFIHISTDEVYGTLGPEGRFTETTPLDPTSPYAASKAGSDLMVLAACKTHKFNACVTRCTNNYGPYQFPEKLIPLFISNALTDQSLPLYGSGTNVRSWVHVNDHCSALLLVAEKGKAGEVYNIGALPEDELSNVDVTKRILAILGKPETLIKQVADRLAHDLRYAVDCAKIKAELGWEPKIRFDQGIAQTAKWYQENEGWWQRIKSGKYMDYYKQQYGQSASV
jgi:dTDP-glucose 4,6-dehydratase